MQLILLTAVAILSLGSTESAQAQAAAGNQAALAKSLQDVYTFWHNAMMAKNANAWNQITASHRRIAIQNRVLSEKVPGQLTCLHSPPLRLNSKD